MINISLSESEKEQRRQLLKDRQYAVRQAWKNEQARVSQGMGTRDWAPKEQKELLNNGHIRGYDGQHMKCVSKYPQYAGDPNNIQFLTEDEHLYGAHRGNYHNTTNGYYDPNSKKMHDFGRSAPKPPQSIKLSNPYVKEAQKQSSSASYLGSASNSKRAENKCDYLGSAQKNGTSSQSTHSQSNKKSLSYEH